MRTTQHAARIVIVVAAVCLAACNKAPDSQPASAATPASTSIPTATPSSDATPAASPSAAAASVGPAPAAPVPAAPVTQELSVPAGTSLALTLSTPVSSDTSRVEERVEAKLATAVSVDGHEAFPAGAEVVGIVTEAEGSGRVKGKAHLAIRFEEIRFDGKAYKISASTAFEAESSGKSDLKKGAIGGAAGAIVGGILGGKKGAVIGGAAGAGGTVLATKGKEVELGAGARIHVKLRSAVTVTVAK
jgi:hypothetical protein